MKYIYITILLLTIFKTGFGQTIGQEVLNYSNGCTDPTSENGGVVIKTKYPFNATTYYMPTVIIEGYNYGKNQSVGLIVNWYIYHYGSVPPYFHHKSISSYGAYTPEVYLFNDNGFVSIFLKKSADSQYCLSFRVRSWLRTINDSGADESWYSGWTANTINTTPVSTNNYEKLTYENTFGDLKVNGVALFKNGNSAGSFTNNQLLLGWNNTSSYLHSIKTRHHSEVASGNAIDFYTWKQGTDVSTSVGTQHVMTMDGQGFVGIGTTTPTAKLEVIGTTKFNSNWFPFTDGNNYHRAINHIFADDAGNEKVRITGSGNVGISTTTIPIGYKLAIGGNVIAEKVVVKLKTDWPDFVFKKTYGLRPLEQVEQYINQNSHLPEVPSAEEISKTGIDLGQMNAKLLQKVEELTLYLIEQSKENKMQSNEIKFLKQEVLNLKNKK